MTSKSQLNLFCQKSRIDVPCYTTERSQDGFISTVTVDGGHHRSKMAHGTKKMAEVDAASTALEAILLEHPGCSTVDEMIDWAEKHRGKRPNFGSPRVPVAQHVSPTVATSHSTVSGHQTPLTSRGTGISPCVAIGSTSPVLRKSNDQALLDGFCSSRGLGEPQYQVRLNRTNLYTATVAIGNEVYTTEQEYDDREMAKDSCTSLAIAALGIRDLKITDADRPQANPTAAVRPLPQHTTSSPVPSPQTQPTQAIQKPSEHTDSTRVTGKRKIVISVTSTKTQPRAQEHKSEVEGVQPSHTKATPVQPSTSVQSTTVSKGDSTDVHLPGSQSPYTPASIQARSTSSDTSSHIQPPSQVASHLPPVNYKQVLNEYCQKSRLPGPVYTCEYPEDTVGYIACVSVLGKEYRSPPQPSKRVAETMAAAEAVSDLSILSASGEVNAGPSPKARGQSACTTAIRGQEASLTALSYKNLLQEYTHKCKAPLPHYETERTGLGFQSTVRVHQYGPSGDVLVFTSGGYPVKKAAEQEAAQIACTELQLLPK